MLTKNVIKEIKSTVLGIAFVIAALTFAYTGIGSIELWIFLIVSGVGLLFARDKYINALEKYFLGNEIKLTDKKNKNDDNE
jgi:hypothetical protein